MKNNLLTDRQTDRQRYVGIKQATIKGYEECEIGGVADFLYPTSKFRRGRVQGKGQISPAITAENTGVCQVTMNELYMKDGVIYPQEDITEPTVNDSEVDWTKTEYRIRKLVPKECFRLMDVTEEDADKVLAINSPTQCYKEAGNSIVVVVLCAIFSQLNIQGIKPWNERTYEEKKALTALEVNKHS